MDECPNCGAEIALGARACWECREPLLTSRPECDPLDEGDDELEFNPEGDGVLGADWGSELGLSPSPSPSPNGRKGRRPRARKHQDGATRPGNAVVAFVAQDEVQAGTIAQLLSDCGIQSFAGHDGDQSGSDGGDSRMHVQVLRRDLEIAMQIIADFTAECDIDE